MKTKTITQFSGYEKEGEIGYSWSINVVVTEDEKIRKKSWIYLRNNKENYEKYGYEALHPEDRGWHMRIGTKNLTRKEICKRYNDSHKEDVKTRCQNYRKEHPEWSKEQTYKRRGMGFIPLNRPFVKSEAHHIDNEYVIYIPTKLHHSIWHCLSTGVGMKEINVIAFGFLLRKQLLSEHNGKVAGLEKR